MDIGSHLGIARAPVRRDSVASLRERIHRSGSANDERILASVTSRVITTSSSAITRTVHVTIAPAFRPTANSYNHRTSLPSLIHQPERGSSMNRLIPTEKLAMCLSTSRATASGGIRARHQSLGDDTQPSAPVTYPPHHVTRTREPWCTTFYWEAH